MSRVEEMTIKEILKAFDGAEVKERHGGKFYFRLYMTKQMSELPIEVLELSVRSYNVLKRAGYHTVGELAEAIAAGMELKKIRNCGNKSEREIMERLFVFQYDYLDPKRRQEYLEEVVKLNQQRKHESPD